MISGGVLSSFPGQNGQNPNCLGGEAAVKSKGRFPRSVEIMTQREVIGSLRSCGIRLFSSFIPGSRRLKPHNSKSRVQKCQWVGTETTTACRACAIRETRRALANDRDTRPH